MLGDSKYYHVRISPKSQNPKADFSNFMNEMEITNEAKWDKDHNGKMKIGDYIGFIVGKAGEEVVHIFKIKSELPLDKRESWWSETAYANNSTNTTKYRVPILLTKDHKFPKTWEWSDIKKKVGIAPNFPTWMPRGTQLVAKKHLLPFLVENK
jgi:hypothetical protein